MPTLKIQKFNKRPGRLIEYIRYFEESIDKFALTNKAIHLMGYFKIDLITETRPFKNVDRENANKWKMTLI